MITGKKKINHVLRKVEQIYKEDLITEVCQIYVQLIIEHELNEQSFKNLLIDYEELFNDYDYDGQYT